MYVSKGLRKKSRAVLHCTATEKRYIQIRARDAGMAVSEYIRKSVMKDSPDRLKTLPPEVMAFNGQLSGIIGALEIIARKRLDNEDLDSLQRAELNFRAKELKLLIENIKSYLK